MKNNNRDNTLHALLGIIASYTLKLVSYIKHIKVVVLIDSGNTHNFIYWCVVKDTHFYVQFISNFQIMISNGCTMKSGVHYENSKLQMGDYHLKTHMFSIDIGGCDIDLGNEWIRNLGPITMI